MHATHSHTHSNWQTSRYFLQGLFRRSDLEIHQRLAHADSNMSRIYVSMRSMRFMYVCMYDVSSMSTILAIFGASHRTQFDCCIHQNKKLMHQDTLFLARAIAHNLTVAYTRVRNLCIKTRNLCLTIPKSDVSNTYLAVFEKCAYSQPAPVSSQDTETSRH